MYYRHKLDYVYPEKSDEHMIQVKHIRDTNFDEHYNYYDKTFWNKSLMHMLLSMPSD